jgi:hypothetical protein
MDMFAYGKALADLWAVGGKALLTGQETAMRALTDTMTKAATQPTTLLPTVASDISELTKASQSVLALWRSAVELSAGLTQKLPKNEPESAATAVFMKMLDPGTWAAASGELDEVMQQLTEGPRLADLWNVERKYTKVLQSWMALRRRSLEHTTIVLEAWLRAANKIAEQLGSPLAEGQQRPTAKEMLAQWIETANQVLLEMQHSSRFLQSQADLLKVSTDLRFAQQELTEYYGEMFGFPTRRELDDVHRAVTELKRELRASRRQARATAAAPSERPPPEAARPRRVRS